ncbi:hypothetical protein FB460_2018 [Propioniferax innocua]|uniref:V8-like Glu-specific endopeptidase n=2 Tax=Propioniferax innocua TaxID=1753 RepID=A0A542ZCU6_9ACTN|nr:hypothetical protein FB460_2018 [Propioniferax innocua]
MERKLFGLSAIALAVCGFGAFGAPAAFAEEPNVVSAEAVETVDVEEYWTAERMENAKSPLELVEGKTGSSGVEIGEPTSGPAQTPKVGPRATPETPQPTIGKVFFTIGGSDFVCSGNSISSENHSVVSTAGHCLNEGPGEFAENWIFVPAYDNGDAPMGKWSAEKLFTSADWADEGDITYDVGFAVMATNDEGQTLADVAGATGWEFNAPRGHSYKSYGYPAAAPFDGQTLQSCEGTASDDPVRPGTTQGIPCDMTGGSSGGPWFIDGGDVQNSVNSYGYTGKEIMYGPYWGEVAHDVYNEASTYGVE